MALSNILPFVHGLPGFLRTLKQFYWTAAEPKGVLTQRDNGTRLAH